MKQQEKREQKLNKLVTRINEELQKETTDQETKKAILSLGQITTFLYSVGRLNDLQVVARLTKQCELLNITAEEVENLLAD